MKKALVVLDLQYDFVYGSLATPEAQAVVPGVVAKINEYKENGDLIFFTLDSHDKNYLTSQEGRNLPIPHCIKGTDGHRMLEEIESLSDDTDIFVEKAAFGSPQLAKSIAGKGGEIREVEMVGLCTDICVISNALLIKAYSPETPISVIAKLCAGTTPEGHKAALEAMKSCHVNIKY